MLALLATLAFAQQDTLTLQQALERARSSRAQVQLARALTSEARSGVGIAGTIPNPQVSYQHTETSYTDEAKVEQRLDWLLSRWPSRAAAQATLRGVEADSVQLIADLARGVRLAFFQTLAAGETRRLIGEQFALADSLLAFAGQRVAAGEISIIEREQFAVEAGRAKQVLLQAEEDERIALVSLGRAIGRSDMTGVVLVESLESDLDGGPAEDASDASTVPLLRRAVADSASAAHLSAVATLERLPIPSLVLGREWDDRPFSSGSGAIFGLSFPLPLWNIGSANASAAGARARAAAARAAERRLEVTELVDRTSLRLASTRERAVYVRDSLLPRAQRLRTGVARLYRAGEISVLQLFDALRSERDVALTYVKTLLEHQQALAEWLAFRGRTE